MPSIFQALSDRIWSRDDYQTPYLVGAIPSPAVNKVLRLNTNVSVHDIRLLNVKPDSECILKLNGRERVRFTADEKGDAKTVLDKPIDLSKFHRVQLYFENKNDMPVLYCFS